MADLLLSVFDTDDAYRLAVLRALGEQQSIHHRWRTGGEWRQLYVSLCDPTGAVRGGVLASTHGIWLEVEFIWVADSFRRQGLGTKMLVAAETEARRRGCQRVYADTGRIAAAHFFLRQGYAVCGELAEYVAGHARYWLHKRLDG